MNFSTYNSTIRIDEGLVLLAVFLAEEGDRGWVEEMGKMSDGDNFYKERRTCFFVGSERTPYVG